MRSTHDHCSLAEHLSACSAWGHDFRPDYLCLGRFVRDFPGVRAGSDDSTSAAGACDGTNRHRHANGKSHARTFRHSCRCGKTLSAPWTCATLVPHASAGYPLIAGTVVFLSSFNRPNIFYEVQRKGANPVKAGPVLPGFHIKSHAGDGRPYPRRVRRQERHRVRASNP